MSVPLLDLAAQYESLRAEIQAAVIGVLESQRFILGPDVAEFEDRCATYCGSAHGIGVSSGTDALLVALMAEGIGPGDEVITTPFTFFATAGCVHRLGATPVFVDIEPHGFNIDAAAIEARITEKTRAIIPVHLFGQCADMDPILDLARQHRLIVIEDAAQAIGAEYAGRRAGSMGDYGCFSFFPSKNLGGVGDGGFVTTQDPERAERLRVLRNHGGQPKYFHPMVGGNFRLDAIQSAVLSVKLPHLDRWTEGRQRNAGRYRELFAELDADDLTLPETLPNRRHIWNQFTLRISRGRRDAVRAYLKDHGIGHEVYYPLPLHLQECFAELRAEPGSLAVAETAAAEVLSIPIYPELTDDQLREVATRVVEAVRESST